MDESEASPAQSVSSDPNGAVEPHLPGWFKVTAIAAASALAGGLAAAWYYRNTLETFRHAEDSPPNPDFGISEAESED